MTPGPNSKYPLERLLKLAEDLVTETLRDKPCQTAEYDPGFISSFYVYPAAEGLACVAFSIALAQPHIDWAA